MNDEQFWGLLDVAGRTAGDDLERRYQAVFDQLKGMSRDDLVDYTVRFAKAHETTFTPGVICGAYMIYEGNLTHDSFLDFSDCLVGLGRTTLERVVACPDFLTGYLELAYCPSLFFWMAGIKAYNSKLKRRESPLEDYLPPLPSGAFEAIHFAGKQGLDVACRESCEVLTPVLAAKFGTTVWSA